MPDLVPPIDRLVVVAERVAAYAAELQSLVRALQDQDEVRESESDGDGQA